MTDENNEIIIIKTLNENVIESLYLAVIRIQNRKSNFKMQDYNDYFPAEVLKAGLDSSYGPTLQILDGSNIDS